MVLRVMENSVADARLDGMGFVLLKAMSVPYCNLMNLQNFYVECAAVSAKNGTFVHFGANTFLRAMLPSPWHDS